MKLLIDTSSSEIIILKIGGNAFTTAAREQKSQLLLPFISESLDSMDITFQDITEIEVAVGEGSFTGIRVGLSVANAIGYVMGVVVNGKIVLS